jgi:hypothetical protein
MQIVNEFFQFLLQFSRTLQLQHQVLERPPAMQTKHMPRMALPLVDLLRLPITWR